MSDKKQTEIHLQVTIGIVQQVDKIGKLTFYCKVLAPEIASTIKPGQFCNIKVSESNYPLLRRPFSISDVEGDCVYFMFDIVGEGTKILSEKVKGDKLDILGSLGRGFSLDGDFEDAVLVAGGIGLAPFPFLLKSLNNKNATVYYGIRNRDHLIDNNIINIDYASDDGSVGFKGNVIELLESKIFDKEKIKIFGCGPTPMLSALKKYCIKNNYACEISTESAMACGFGICQGCPIETTPEGYYKLICKDGPVFNINEVEI